MLRNGLSADIDLHQNPPSAERTTLDLSAWVQLPTLTAQTDIAAARVCKPNCKRTRRHGTVLEITGQHRGTRNGELEHTVNHVATRDSTRILELENRCTRKRPVGSNPTLSAKADCIR
jgi:hypothetical protein